MRQGFPGERDNARNNARFTQARKATHGLDGQHQDAYRRTGLAVEESIRMAKREINAESTSMVWPTLGSTTAKEQNNTI